MRKLYLRENRKKLKLLQNSKTQIKFRKNSKTPIVEEIRNSNGDKAQIVKKKN